MLSLQHLFWVFAILNYVFCDEFCCNSCRNVNFTGGPLSVPPYVGQCDGRLKNPALSACITARADDLIPRFKYGDVHYGIPKLYPYFTYEWSIDICGNGPNQQVTILPDSQMYNLWKCRAVNITYDIASFTVTRKEVFAEQLVIKGNVAINGKFCGKQVNDDGCITITLNKIGINFQPTVIGYQKYNYSWIYITESFGQIVTLDSVDVEFEGLKPENSFFSNCYTSNKNQVKTQIVTGLQPAFGNIEKCITNAIIGPCPNWALFPNAVDDPRTNPPPS